MKSMRIARVSTTRPPGLEFARAECVQQIAGMQAETQEELHARKVVNREVSRCGTLENRSEVFTREIEMVAVNYRMVRLALMKAKLHIRQIAT
jgi:hypothetical protein